jgi:beta-glucosidase
LLQNYSADREQDDMAGVVIPDGFELGVATSAYQIEGAWNLDGKGPSIWDTFTNSPGHTRGDVPGNDGVDHYRRLDEDVAHLQALGVNAYRFSLSWPRILPSGTGAVNAAGVDFYDRLIDRLLESGITPNATLYHWDLPQALEDRGGWVNPQMPRWFSEYAALCFERFGDRVQRWATINEPIALWVGYGLGIFAPGTIDPRAGKQAMHHAMVAHGQAVQAFRASGKPGTIGIVLDVWKRHPATDSDADKALAQHDENDGFRFFFDELFAGGWNSSLQEQMRVENVTPRHTDEDFQCAAEPIDWLGLNIYSRVLVSAENYNPRWWEASEEQIFPGGNFLANGQEFYPPALRDAVEIARNEYAVNVPIYITENGCPDSASKPGTPCCEMANGFGTCPRSSTRRFARPGMAWGWPDTMRGRCSTRMNGRRPTPSGSASSTSTHRPWSESGKTPRTGSGTYAGTDASPSPLKPTTGDTAVRSLDAPSATL